MSEIPEFEAEIEEEIVNDLSKTINKKVSSYHKIIFISDLLRKQEEIRALLDTRTNIVIGIDSALIVFLITNFHENLINGYTLLLALGTVVISLFCAILALKPPRMITKKGQAESLFYHHHIGSKEIEKFREEVYTTMRDENRIFDTYINETYNLTAYSNIPRKFYLYLAIKVLIYGIFLNVAIYAFSLISSLLAGNNPFGLI